MQSNTIDTILFFDGVCNLCNGTIDYIIRNEKHPTLKFSSLQSDFAQQFLGPKDISLLQVDSVVLFKNDELYTASQAVVQVLIAMGGIHTMFGKLIRILPNKLADFFYRVVAKRRYRWFGKSETCRIPTKEEQDRFLE